MSRLIVLGIFAFFVTFTLMLVIDAIRTKIKDRKRKNEIKQAPKAESDWRKMHVHSWRYIFRSADGQSEGYVRQCVDRRCSFVDEFGDVPENMMRYVNLMTTVAAKNDPIAESKKFSDEGEE
jgi:hypothetical protein